MDKINKKSGDNRGTGVLFWKKHRKARLNTVPERLVILYRHTSKKGKDAKKVTLDGGEMVRRRCRKSTLAKLSKL